MKKYYQFIEENYKNRTKFAIDIRGDNGDKLKIIFDLALKYFTNSDYLEEEFKYIIERLESTTPTQAYSDKMPPWAIIFEVERKHCNIYVVTTPEWGESEEYMKNILTVDEFLNVGFENIEAYFSAKKFNL